MEGRNGGADIENRLINTGREGESGTSGESSLDIYTHPCVKQIAGAGEKPGAGPSSKSQWHMQRPWGRNPLGVLEEVSVAGGEGGRQTNLSWEGLAGVRP